MVGFPKLGHICKLLNIRTLGVKMEDQEKPLPNFSVKELSDFLAKAFNQDIADSFEKNKISGPLFLKLSENQFGKIVEAIGDVIELQYRVQESVAPKPQVRNKIIVCPTSLCKFNDCKVQSNWTVGKISTVTRGIDSTLVHMRMEPTKV